VALSLMILVGLPILVGLVPLRSQVCTSAQLVRADEHVLRAGQAGFVERVAVEPGQPVAAGDLLVQLVNPEIHHRLLEAEAEEAVSRIKARAFASEEPGRALTEERLARVHAAEAARRRDDLAQLALHAPIAGLVLWAPPHSDEGRFVQEGEPIATVASGDWRVRALLTANEVAAASPQEGQRVELRSPADPGRTIEGEVLRVAPSGSRSIDLPALTHLGGGEIPVQEEQLEADQPYFELTIAVFAADLHDGMRAQVRLKGNREPLAVSTFRRVLRVVNRISRT
jgi:multidrug resistance efflux pump